MTTVDISSLRKAAEFLADTMGRDVTLRQIHTLIVVAEAGDAGIDVSELGRRTHSSPAAVSRNVRVLGMHHYDRNRGAGMELLEVTLDPADNRRRLVRIAERGRRTVRAVAALAAGASGIDAPRTRAQAVVRA